MKKYLILFISFFTSFFLIDKVSASTRNFSNIDYNAISIDYEQQVSDGWLPYASSLNTTNSGNYTIYLKSSDKSVIGYKRSGASHILDNMYVISWPSATGFEYNNVAFITYAGSSDTDTLILSKGSLPTLGGDCETGSFCYNIVNSGSQGNGRSAYFNSETIILSTIGFVDPTFYAFGYPHRLYYNGISQQRDVGTGTFVTYNSSSTFYSTQYLYNNGNYSPPNNEIVPLPSVDPDYDYEIMEGSEKGKRVLFEFENFSENSFINVVDMSSGNILNQEDLKNNNQFDIDNISYDSIFYYEIYNNDELFDSGSINVYSDFLATGQPIVRIDLLTNEKTSVLSYEDIKDDYQLYYAINNDNFINLSDNPENLEIANLGNSKKIFFPNTGVRENNNYVLRGRITDSNGRILYDIGYNVVFFPDKPYFSFSSSYNSTSGANEVEITLHNFQNNDIVYYSYDNINFTQFDNINVNKLEVYSDTDIYTKVVRGNNTYYGFYHVNLNAYNNSSNSIYDNTNGYNDNLFTGFKNLFTGVDLSFLDNISSFFNALKGSYVFRFVMLCITGSLILFIMRMIRR